VQQEQVCGLCQEKELKLLIEKNNIPILKNRFYPARNIAEASLTSKINYLFCPHCVYAFNPFFKENETDYSLYYHPNFSFPRIFKDYIDFFITRISEDLKIKKNSKILEIGCGDGFFLSRLKNLLNTNNISGYDPAYTGLYDMGNFIKNELYKSSDEEFDFIFIRNTFEQLIDYELILTDLFKKVLAGAKLIIETPDLSRILENRDQCFFSQEYHRLFSLQALSIMANKHDLEIYSTYRLLSDRQLVVVFKAAPNYKLLELDKSYFLNLLKEYPKIVVWGANNKTVNFLADSELNADQIQFVIDPDRRISNQYVPVTGQRVINPTQAKKYNPDLILLTELEALEEVKQLFGDHCTIMSTDGSLLHKKA
jgi:hypothetical protein